MPNLIITSNKYSFCQYNLTTKELYTKEKVDVLLTLHMKTSRVSSFHPYGIDCDDSYLYIAGHNKMCRFDRNDFNIVEKVDVPLFSNTHQIVKDGDILYVANTETDTLGIYNLKTNDYKFLSTIDFRFVREPDKIKYNSIDIVEQDKTHLNSLFNYDNKIYFCLHNKANSKSDFYFLDKETHLVEFIISEGVCCHGIYIKDNILYTLSTNEKSLVNINLLTKEVKSHKLKVTFDTFIRGLTFYNGKLLIGCSVNFKCAESNKMYANIISFDIETNKIEKFLDLPEIKFISDLKVI